MNCSPCGSGSNYTSISSLNCVTLCGAGISTMIANSSIVSYISGGTVAVEGLRFDPFNRLITQTPTTMMTAHATFTPQYDIVGYTSTGAASIMVDLSSSVVYMSTLGSGGRAIRQTLEYQLYEPGKAHQAFFTWIPQVSGTFDTSVAIRAGIYDDYRDKNTPAGITGPPPYLYQSSINGGLGQETNQPSMGHFFELSGNAWFVVERANSSNNINNVTRVAQSNWNKDTLNPAYGNNPSGVTLTTSNEGLFFIDRQWLGVGIVNMGIYSSGNSIICHQFQNRGLQRPYTQLNKLPLRFELEKVPGGTSNIAMTGNICFASHIQGEYSAVGTVFSLPANITYTATNIDTTLVPILVIRLKQGACRATIKIKDIEMYGQSAGVFSLFKNPTISGNIAWTNHPDSRSLSQYAVFMNGTAAPTNTITGGQCIQSGFFEKRASQAGFQSVADLIAAPSFCSDIKGNPDVFCIAMAGFSANVDVYANCRWLEIV